MSQSTGALALGTEFAPAGSRRRTAAVGHVVPSVSRGLMHVTAAALRVAAVAGAVITVGAGVGLLTAGIGPAATAVALAIVTALGAFFVLVALAGAELLYAVVRLSDRFDSLASTLAAEQRRSAV